MAPRPPRGNTMIYYTTDNGTEWAVRAYKQIRKYSARSESGAVVTAASYIKLMAKMEEAS